MQFELVINTIVLISLYASEYLKCAVMYAVNNKKKKKNHRILVLLSNTEHEKQLPC